MVGGTGLEPVTPTVSWCGHPLLRLKCLTRGGSPLNLWDCLGRSMGLVPRVSNPKAKVSFFDFFLKVCRAYALAPLLTCRQIIEAQKKTPPPIGRGFLLFGREFDRRFFFSYNRVSWNLVTL